MIRNGTYKTLIPLYKDPYIEQRKWMEENKDKYEDDFLLYHDSLSILHKEEAKLYNNKKINTIVKWIKNKMAKLL